MSFKKKGHGGGGGGHDGGGGLRWLLTYADLITLLLVFFIIAYASAMQDAQKMQQVSESLAAAFRPFSSRLHRPIKSGGEGTGIRTPGTVTTDSLQMLVTELGEAVNLLDQEAQLRYVEGHLAIDIPLPYLSEGDLVNAPEPTRAFMGRLGGLLHIFPNQVEIVAYHRSALPAGIEPWSLTTRQATAVARHLVNVNGIDPMRISAMGRGPNRPFQSDETESAPVDGVTLLILKDKGAPRAREG